MKLTQKLFFFFFVTLISTGLCVYFLSSQIFLRGFSQIEDEMAIRNLHRTAEILKHESQSLAESSVSWSSWDDTYEYLAKRNARYEKNNWESSAIFESKYSQVILADLKNNIVFSKGYDPDNKTFNEIEAAQLNLLKEEILPLVGGKDPVATNGYFIGAGSKAYAISISPILTSLAKGPSRGWFILLREINDGVRKRFSESLKLEMDISVGSSQEWSEKVTEDGYLLKGANSIQGLIATPDITGRKKLIARLYIPRTIYS